MTRRLETQSRQEPEDKALLILIRYVFDERIAELERKDADLTAQAANIYDNQSIVLSDSRHVLPDNNEDFWIITRGFDDPGVKLDGKDKIEAQRIYSCRKAGSGNCGPGNSGDISPGLGKILLDALASAMKNGHNTGGKSASPQHAPAPGATNPPPPKNNEPNDDDPIGPGGFITPPSGY